MRAVVEVLRHRFDTENTKVVAGPVPLVLGWELFEPAELQDKNANSRIGLRTVTIHIHNLQIGSPRLIINQDTRHNQRGDALWTRTLRM
jgi:hypothetical protein